MDTSQLTLKPLLSNAMAKYRARIAAHCDGKTLTYGALYQQSCRAADALIRAGVRPNVRVALLMSNGLEYLVVDLAIIQSGAVKVPLNDMLGEKEIRYILADSGARVVIVDPGFFDIVARSRAACPDLEQVIGLAPQEDCPEGFISWETFLAGGREDPPLQSPKPDDLALIMYTGGTTGRPKGVQHTQQGMALNLFSHIIEMQVQDDERLLLCSPLPHSAGFLLLAGLLKGVEHFIETRFTPEMFVRRIEEDRVTLTFMVPTMIYRALDWIGDQAFDLSAMRTIVYGAAPITVQRLRQALNLFGPVFIQIYGQSEAPNLATRLQREDHRLDEAIRHRLKSCGKPTMMAEVRIIDDSGNGVPRGVSGELAIRSPYNTVGYQGLPDKTAETLVGGWLRTGDIACQDEDGYVYLLDRTKDMIITGGMNVYTREVEDAVQTCPGVGQVAVAGLPHPDWGEVVTAFVIREAGATVTEAEVIAHCRGELSKYKQPKRVHFLEQIPVTAYGKPDKKALRQHAESEITE